MTRRSPATAIARLVRWREFEQERACVALMSRIGEVANARERVAEAEKSVQGVASGINEVLACAKVDLARLLVLSGIEAAAWERSQVVAAKLVEAREHHAAARGIHLRARTRTQIAATRKADVVRVHQDSEEKRAFDRMADLYRPAARRPR